jgi:N-glycosylase/DNA lyase
MIRSYIKSTTGAIVNYLCSIGIHSMEYTMGLDSPFSLEYTLESGQVFRWERRGEWWRGVVSGGVLSLKQEGDSLKCVSSGEALGSTFVRNYFRLDEDFEAVLQSIAKDKTITYAVQKFYGLRLIRQDRWECLASFLLATNSNIPRIKKMIAAVCRKFGEAFQFDGEEFRSFPKPGALAAASTEDLRGCGLGYRAPFLRHVAKAVEKGEVDFTEIATLNYPEARNRLLTELLGEKVLPGVGPKVSDCVLLYSFGQDQAFPIDVWIARQLAKSYPRLFSRDLRRKLSREGTARMTLHDYEKASEETRRYFGKYAGYAQQYLFVSARSTVE